jgi:hypothetical protein
LQSPRSCERAHVSLYISAGRWGHVQGIGIVVDSLPADVIGVTTSSSALSMSASGFVGLLLLIVLPSRQGAGELPPYTVRSSSLPWTSLSLKYSFLRQSPGVMKPGEELRGGKGSSSSGAKELSNFKQEGRV